MGYLAVPRGCQDIGATPGGFEFQTGWLLCHRGVQPSHLRFLAAFFLAGAFFLAAFFFAFFLAMSSNPFVGQRSGVGLGLEIFNYVMRSTSIENFKLLNFSASSRALLESTQTFPQHERVASWHFRALTARLSVHACLLIEP